MALSELKFTSGELVDKDIASLPDQPSAAGITAAQLKARFDLIPKMLVALGKFNQVVDLLVSSGGAELGAAVLELSGGTVQALLVQLKTLADGLRTDLGNHTGNTVNPHQVTKVQVGLGRADNTSDLEKPISTAQAAVNQSAAAGLADRYTKAQADGLLAGKSDKTTTNVHIKEVTFNAQTGVFQFIRENGTTFSIDTLLEKIPIDVRLEGTELVLTLSDGTKQRADLASFIDTYTFLDTESVVFSQAGKVISAIVKDGSLTLDKLTPEAQAALLGYVARAETAATKAETAQAASEVARDTAKGHADTAAGKVGEVEASAVAAKASQDAAAVSAQNLATGVEEARTQAVNAANSAVAAKDSREKTSASEAKALASEEHAKTSETAAAASELAAADHAAEALSSRTAAATSAAEAAGHVTEATQKAEEAAGAASEAAASAQAIAGAEDRTAASAATATDKAVLAQSYAVGGTGTREGEDTDNAKYYKEQAGSIVGGDYATHLELSTAKEEAIATAAADATQKAETAEANAKAASIPLVQKGTAEGVATLDAAGKVPAVQLPPMDYDAAGSAAAVQAVLNGHTENKGNPHGVTAGQVGAVPTGRKVNGKPLAVDIQLTAVDVGADPEGSAAAVRDSLAPVATSGSFHDLMDKPPSFDPGTLAKVATTGAYGDLSGAPVLGNAAAKNVGTAMGTVAEGDHTHTGYAALTHSHPVGQISGLGGAATLNVGTVAGTVAVGNHTHTPASIGAAMESHAHIALQITGLNSVATTGYVTVGRKAGTISAVKSTAEGSNTTASGNSAHAEGTSTTASGEYSHAEGTSTTAGAKSSHAEGWYTKASGEGSHAEGYQITSFKNVAYGRGSHVEGIDTIAGKSTDAADANIAAHAEGYNTTASGNNAHAEGQETTASGNYSHAEGKNTAASGNYSHAEGSGSLASGSYSHAEGDSSRAVGNFGSHAEGYFTNANGNSSHAEGDQTSTSATASHAEGQKTAANGTASHAEGQNTKAYGYGSHTEGLSTIAGNSSVSATVESAAHAEGKNTVASGGWSHAEGIGTAAKGGASHTGGNNTIANDYQYAIGTYNVESSGGEGTIGDRFIIGNGTSSARSNAFRVTSAGKAYGKTTFGTSGADYAEFWEWQDGNPNGEDRRGRFVTLDGEKIRLATVKDDFLLGIISGRPAVLGNNYDDEWNGRFLQDIYGDYVMSQYDKEAEYDKDGNVIIEASTYEWYTPNPDYDSSQVYVPREKRKEWAMVGIMGQLIVADDGTCQVNGHCLPVQDGIATATENKRGYRVMARKDATHVLVYVYGQIQL